MKRLYILLVALFTINGVKAQQSTFSKVFYDISGNDQAYSIAKSFDNYFVIAGESDLNGLVMKIDTGGNIMWSKKVGNDNATSFSRIISTSDSCFVLLGKCLNAGLTASDIFYIKINANGDTLWSKSIALGFPVYSTSIQQTNDKGYIVSGFIYQGLTTPYSIIVIIKLDASGNITWLKKITCGNYENEAFSVKQLPDSGYIVSGFLENHIGSTFDGRGCLIKLTSNGTVSWAKNTDQSFVWGYDVTIANNGFICNWGLNNGNGMVIMKTDFSGNVLWSKHYLYMGSSSVSNGPMPKLYFTLDNNLVFVNAGIFTYGAIVKMDTLGDLIWAKNLGFYSTDIIQSSDTGFLVLGNGPVYGVKTVPTNNQQIGIIKTDSTGNATSACIYDVIPTYDTISMNLTPVTYSTATGGLVTTLHPVVTDFTLSATNGCVSFIGNVEEHNSENIVIYPNPAQENLTIEISAFSKDVSLSLYNIEGQMVMQQPIRQSKSTINVSNLPQGLYMIRLNTADGIAVKKFIKE